MPIFNGITYQFLFLLKPWDTANGRSTVNLERRSDHDGHPLAITAADAVGASGVSPWNWRGTSGNGQSSNHM